MEFKDVIQEVLTNQDLFIKAYKSFPGETSEYNDEQIIYLIARIKHQGYKSDKFNNTSSEEFDKITKQQKTQGYIIHQHLIVEHYILKYLDIIYPRSKKKSLENLSFSLKSMMCFDLYDSTLFFFREGINELNKIRNKYAHNLKYDIGIDKITEIKKTIISELGKVAFFCDIGNINSINTESLINKFIEAFCFQVDVVIDDIKNYGHWNDCPSYRKFL